jgi:hypothetical protein
MQQLAAQMADQNTARGPGNPNWRPGVSGNPRGRLSKAERDAKVRRTMIRLARPLGGIQKLTALELERLKLAAELLQRQPRNAEDRVRVANCIDRMLGSVERARMAAKPQRRQSTKAHMAPSELPRSLRDLTKGKP